MKQIASKERFTGLEYNFQDETSHKMTYNQGNETSLRVQRDSEIINAFELIFWRVPYVLKQKNYSCMKQLHIYCISDKTSISERDIFMLNQRDLSFRTEIILLNSIN